jgi:2-succinyl-5-enolpyruvyl-6-hydroxy-3-cyclohexene-1-carboxylate synthase
LHPQTIDLLTPPSDAYRRSFLCRSVKTDADVHDCERIINEAILELTRFGGGPVNINLVTSMTNGFHTIQLPIVRKICRWEIDSDKSRFPQIKPGTKIAFVLGSRRMPREKIRYEQEKASVESFINMYDAVVLTDRTSEYDGKNRVDADLLFRQEGLFKNPDYSSLRPDLIIHIGETSGAYTPMQCLSWAPVWRVSEDGELRDPNSRLEHVFTMTWSEFCDVFSSKAEKPVDIGYAAAWLNADRKLRSIIPELPFSHAWIAQRMHLMLPVGCRLHLGIYNALKMWDCFPIDKSIRASSNVGGFGIDGCVSTLIGASLASPEKLCIGVVGDLAFFYDLNALGNRHIGKNIRIVLVNNGTGAEFNIYHNPGMQFGEQVNDYIAAGGHNGNQSRQLVRHLAEDLGFQYLAAEDKEKFDDVILQFLNFDCEHPVLLECFTTPQDESDAQYILDHLVASTVQKSKQTNLIEVAKAVVPQRVKRALKELLRHG